MTAYNVISADSHVIEPPDLWLKDVPESDRRKIVAENAMRLFGFGRAARSRGRPVTVR